MNYKDNRAARMRASCANISLPKIADEPLLLAYQLTDRQFDLLRSYVNVYLFDSLAATTPRLSLCDHMLGHYSDEIRALPNITPNGLLLPKRHSWLSFNMLTKHVADIVRSFGLRDAAGLHFPINVRIVDGGGNPTVDSRPRASVKLHSDVWAGELANHIMMYFPIMGDMDRNGVELFEPCEAFFPSFVRALADFNEGAHLEQTARKYDLVMRPGGVYFLDAYLLHRTMKQTPGLRLVINFAYTTHSVLDSDLHVDTDRRAEYVAYDDWMQYGDTKLLATRNEMRRFSSDETSKVVNAYAEKYDTIEYPDDLFVPARGGTDAGTLPGAQDLTSKG